MPISEVLLRGSAPNIFMSRAESHEVGGGKGERETKGGEGGGVEGRVLKDRGAGEGECLSLSFTVIADGVKQGDQVMSRVTVSVTEER